MSQEQERIRFLLSDVKEMLQYLSDLDLTSVTDVHYGHKAAEHILVKMTAISHNLQWILEARRNVFNLPLGRKKK